MNNEGNPITALELSPEFKKKVEEFKKEWWAKYKKISKEKTPQVDGAGRKIIDRKGNYDYIIVAYMVECLDKHFPGWSWEMAAPVQFLGGEWVVAQGTLSIIDEYLVAFGFSPPVRRFYGCNAARITYGQGKPHTVENIIDVGNNVKSANTEAMKVAINRLTHIGDDVYGKRIEEEGAGSLEDVVLATGDSAAFGRWVADNSLSFGEVMSILGISSMKEIADYIDAMKKIKTAKGWK